mmetsp:Transcript_44676/g.104089  ORF Transcript_44676/g.104089 Transcript_44676/m.104089 type:complete len:179 (+) Transcript_44676:87-623(+)
MGVSATKSGAGGLMPRGSGCCASRLTHPYCRNDFLAIYLAKLEHQNQEFDSAYLYRQVKAGPGNQSPKYVLMYQRTELAVVEVPESDTGVKALVPHKVRRLLRLDWGPDGLAFDEFATRLPESALVQSKVFSSALTPSELQQQLTEVWHKTFDPDEWSSFNFCHHFMAQIAGKTYQYK